MRRFEEILVVFTFSALIVMALAALGRPSKPSLVLRVTPRFSAQPISPLVTITLKNPNERMYCPKIIYKILDPAHPSEYIYRDERESDCEPWPEWAAQGVPKDIVWSWRPNIALPGLPAPLEWAIVVRLEQGTEALTETVYVRIVG